MKSFAIDETSSLTTTEFHITRTTATDVYGHETTHCDPSGCNGDEQRIIDQPAETVRVGEVIVVDNESREVIA